MIRTLRTWIPAKFVLPMRARISIGVLGFFVAIFVARMVDHDFPPVAVVAIMLATAGSVYTFTTHSLSIWLALVFRL